MAPKLSAEQLGVLREWEPRLIAAVRKSDARGARAAIEAIQLAFVNDRSHHRLLRAKNWYYDCLLAVGKTADAKVGLQAVQQRAKEGTRLFAECASQLAICCIRLRLYEEAKRHLRTVIENINAITSPARRQQFQKRVIERLGEEVLLSQLLDRDEGEMDPKTIHEQAVKMTREKTLDEIYDEVGKFVPSGTPLLIKNVQEHALTLMPASDRQLLEAPKGTMPKSVAGKKVMNALQRILWKSLCDDDSVICGLWKKKVPSFFGEGYLTLAIVTTMKEWRIGLPSLAAAGGAVMMSKSCEVFCETCKPAGLMIPRTDKPEG